MALKKQIDLYIGSNNEIPKISYRLLDIIKIFRKESKPFIFLDWDDTLFFTTFISTEKYGKKLENIRINMKGITMNEYMLMNPPLNFAENYYNEKIIEFDLSVSEMLRDIKKLGIVFIVTNATDGWIRDTSTFYMPKTFKELEDIEQWSAQSTYKNIYTTKYNGFQIKWKYEMFKYLLLQNKLNHNKHVISIGDSDQELKAMQQLKLELPNYSFNLVKLKNEPSIVDLKQEIDILKKEIPLLTTKKNSDVMMIEKFKNTIEGGINNKIVWFQHCY